MDRFEAMRVLLAALDHGSLSAAGRALGMPLATVSRKISELETHLGTRLLVRTTRRLAITDAGAGYVASARRILEQVEEAERQAAGEFMAPRGELVLTAPVLFGRLHVLPVVAEFLARYPEIDVRLPLSDRNLHLAEDHVDMAVRIGPLPDSAMVATRVGAMRMVTCASPGLLKAHGVPKDPGALAAMPCVNFDMLAPAAIWRFGKGRTARQVQIRPRLRVSAADLAVDAAIAGIGATRLLHYQCAAALADGALRLILEDAEPEPAPVHLLHATRGTLPLKMRAFLDFAAPRLRARLTALEAGRDA